MREIKILVGPPASGKTTWAKDYVNSHPNWIVLSSDDVREELYGNEQGSPKVVFQVVQERLENFLQHDYNAIVDATNMSRKDRRVYFPIAKKHNARIGAVVFPLPYEECILRNDIRVKKVPDGVIERMISRFEMPIKGEGFETIVFKRDNISFAPNDKLFMDFKNFGNQRCKHHTLPLYEHCVACFDNVKEDVPVVKEAALYHDLGKIYTRIYDEEGNAHYYNHANWSAYQGVAFFIVSYEAAVLINYHTMAWQNAALPKLQKLLGEEQYNNLMLLHEADKEAH